MIQIKMNGFLFLKCIKLSCTVEFSKLRTEWLLIIWKTYGELFNWKQVQTSLPKIQHVMLEHKKIKYYRKTFLGYKLLCDLAEALYCCQRSQMV